MRNKNTMGRLEYVWANLYWAFLGFLLYRDYLFLPLFAFDNRQSLFLLAGFVILGVSIGIFLTHKRRRNRVSLACNLLLSYGIYHALSLWFIDRTKFTIVGLIAVILAASYSLLVIVTYFYYRRRSALNVNIWKCLSSCMLNCRTIVACVFAATIMLTLVKTTFDFPALELKEDTVPLNASAATEGETIAKNMDIVLLLQEDKWCHLDATERLNVMKTIADIEPNYLGFPEVSVCAEVLKEHNLGHYNNTTRTITLNLSYLVTADAHTMLTTVCHESYHAYQHRLVEVYDELASEDKDLLLFSEAAQYRDEFANYIVGSDGYYAYSNQLCEVDSTKYAEEAVIDYYYRIDQYYKEHQ